MKPSLKIIFAFLSIISLTLWSCSHEKLEPKSVNEFEVNGSTITRNNIAFYANGVNTLNTFGLSNGELIKPWNIKIVREFIGNLREQPIEGAAILDATGSYLHALQTVVNANRVNGVVTILCPFKWVDEQGAQTYFTGLNPTSQTFYQSYKVKMRAIAEQFKNQPDVWVEVWNEPYHFNNSNSYTHYLWLSNQIDMVDNLRAVDGFNNIIVVPGNEQGQSESAILEQGKWLLENRTNIVFDLHAYEKWLLNTTKAAIKTRVSNLNAAGFSFIFGEVGVINASGLMPVDAFLSAVSETNTITLAWLFNRNTGDQNSLLTDDGLENNTNNNNWGSTFKSFLNN